jgi:hypothetical protein
MRHPYSGLLYELGDADEVVVSGVGPDGSAVRGTFDAEGRWCHGDRFTVCPHFCLWIGRGPRETPPLSANRRFMTVTRPVDAEAPTAGSSGTPGTAR